MSKPWLKPQLAGCPDASAIQPEASVPYDPASCPKPAQAHLIPLLLPTADTGKMWMDLSFSKIQKALDLGSVFHLLPVWTPHPSIMGPAPGPALHSSCGLKMAQYTLLFWTRLLMRVGWTASMENLLTTRRFTSAQCITEYKTKDYPDGNPQLDPECLNVIVYYICLFPSHIHSLEHPYRDITHTPKQSPVCGGSYRGNDKQLASHEVEHPHSARALCVGQQRTIIAPRHPSPLGLGVFRN